MLMVMEISVSVQLAQLRWACVRQSLMIAKSVWRRKTIYFMAVKRQVLNKKDVKKKIAFKGTVICFLQP